MTAPQLGPRTLTESARVEAFSDGVLAIALTLLVLDLHSDAARGEFGHELATQWPSYLAYLAAFLNLSAIWINHHDLFARVHRVDARLLVVNLAVLLVASVFPWPTAVMAAAIRDGNSHDQLLSTLLYAATRTPCSRNTSAVAATMVRCTSGSGASLLRRRVRGPVMRPRFGAYLPLNENSIFV